MSRPVLMGTLRLVPGSPPWREAATVLLAESGCTVRKWRRGTTGRAFVRAPDWGIEAPEPRGPVSFATLAHEVGHQMLHRDRDQARWIEEAEAWRYALDAFDRFDLPQREKAERDALTCMAYAVEKAMRRGAKAGEDEITDMVIDVLGPLRLSGRNR